MTETVSPFFTYSDDRLLQAQETVRARVRLAERNLERVLAHEERARAATVCGRQYLARAKGDERLIEAILKERETVFEEEGGISLSEEKEKTGDSISFPLAPAPRSQSSPESLRQRQFSRSAFP